MTLQFIPEPPLAVCYLNTASNTFEAPSAKLANASQNDRRASLCDSRARHRVTSALSVCGTPTQLIEVEAESRRGVYRRLVVKENDLVICHLTKLRVGSCHGRER